MVYEPLQNQLFNDPKITKLCIESAKEFYGANNVLELSKPSMGGEDFADYLEKVSGNFAFIGSAKDKDTVYPWHHNRFNIDESVLPKAAKYMAYTAQKLLNAL
jgi:amidohydrolase